VDLGERSKHSNVGALANETDDGPGFEVRREFEIGFIDDDERAPRKAMHEVDELRRLAHRAGRIVRVDKIDGTGTRIHPVSYRTQIVFEPLVERNANGDTACRCNRVDQCGIAWDGIDELAARTAIC
jgi:hypothetical protein